MIPANPMTIATSATDRLRLDLAFAVGARMPVLPRSIEPVARRSA